MCEVREGRKGAKRARRRRGKGAGAREGKERGEERKRRKGGGEKETSEIICHHLDLARNWETKFFKITVKFLKFIFKNLRFFKNFKNLKCQ